MPAHAPAHVRVTMSGTLPGNEIFSCSLSLKGLFSGAPDPSPAEAINVDPVGYPSSKQRVVDAVTAFWVKAEAGMTEAAHLTNLRFAPIGDDGLYTAASQDVPVDVRGLTGIASSPPNQIARKVTLLSDGDLGRVKGGFYLPSPGLNTVDISTQLASAAAAEGVASAVATMLHDIEDNGPSDLFTWRVVIASAGRHNADGTVRRPPTLHDVTQVSVGRRLDVQRRRANKISEVRGEPADF